MRRMTAPCACVLALITGAWFGQAYTLFAPIEAIPTEDAAARAAVSTAWRFYDAIDILLRTADDSALLAVIAPEFVDHFDEPGTALGRDGLVRYLASLRETHPGLRLLPEDIVAQGDRFFARLAPMHTDDAAILGIPLTGKEPWPRIDVMRVQGGRVVERWGDPAGYAPTTEIFSEFLTFPYQGTLVPLLRRMTVAPGAIDASTFQWGQTIVAVESGVLDITAESGDPSSSASSPVDVGNATSPGGPTATLSPGDAIAIADGVAFAVANRTTTPTVFLALTLVQPVPASLRARDDHTTYASVTVTDRISIQNLSGNTATTTHPGHLSASLARITLAAGARLTPHPVAGLEIVVVDSGTVTASVTKSPTSAWVRDPRGRLVSAEGWEQLSAEYSLTVENGATSGYANESTQPATLLLLTLTTTLVH